MTKYDIRRNWEAHIVSFHFWGDSDSQEMFALNLGLDLT